MKKFTLYNAQNQPIIPEENKKLRNERVNVLKENCYDPNSYDFDENFRPADPDKPLEVHTTYEMLKCLDKNPHIQLDARILSVHNKGWGVQKFDRNTFREAFARDPGEKIKMRETDNFATDGSTAGTVGNDFTPLVGGPYYKNLYYYQDYIRMHSEAFYSKNHDPIANAGIGITRDFTLGAGYEVQADINTKQGMMAMAVWKAFESVNNLHEQFDQLGEELPTYGETMWWWLPNNQTKIIYQLPNNQVPTGIIPRVRLIDPSNIVEIVTYPEDITRPLFYVWLTPTQYQIYNTGTGMPNNQGQFAKPNLADNQPTIKFIYQQVPAEQMMHFKINAMSNEKRGRSDLFPVFSYLKRLRDSVNFSLISLQKVSAWSIDTTIEGDQTDIDNYVRSQQALGTIPNAGSDFVHSAAVKRDYLGNSAASAGVSNAFDWAFSMIAAGLRIPVSYFGTHLSGGNTRASAIVSTEPVAKKMQKRQELMKRMLKQFWDRLMKEAGLGAIDCNIIFPEIISTDRSAKLKDVTLAQQQRWIAPKTAATIVAKELQIQNYDYNAELAQMDEQLPQVPMPLANPGKVSVTAPMQMPEEPQASGLTQNDRKDIKQDGSQL